MTNYRQAILGALMVFIGSIKTWLHMGSVPILSLPTCNGKTVSIALGQTSWLEQAHCWGCYMFAAGLVMVAVAGWRAFSKRRSVALNMD
jgi:hypothetical protein